MPEVQVASNATDPTDGLFEANEIAVPDFKKLKKAQLKEFFAHQITHIEQHENAISELEFHSYNVGAMRAYLESVFDAPKGNGHDLSSPEVTGFDPNDLIHATIADVQKIEDETHLIEQVLLIQDAAEFNFFRMGGLLAEANSRGYVGEFENFFVFAEATFGLAKRKSQALMQVYHALVACGATWSEAKKIGWAKLMVIATLLTPENYKGWFEKVEDASFATVQQSVAEYRESLKNGGDTQEPSDIESTPIKKMSFQLHEEQVETVKGALEVSKEKSGTEFDGPALEFICLDFMGSAGQSAKAAKSESVSGTESVSLKGIMQSLAADDEGFVTVLETFSEVFSDIDIDVWPDGKPNCEGLVANLIEEFGASDVQAALEVLSE